MSIDLSQFYEVFIDESFEGHETMESELLNWSPGDVDSEIINNILKNGIYRSFFAFDFKVILNIKLVFLLKVIIYFELFDVTMKIIFEQGNRQLSLNILYLFS